MKLCRFRASGSDRVGVCTGRGVVDLSAYSDDITIERIISEGVKLVPSQDVLSGLPVVEEPVFSTVLAKPNKLLCVGLNYMAHAVGTKEAFDGMPQQPLLFCKLDCAFAASGDRVALPPWEISYDYEAELVVIVGKEAWNVSVEDAKDYIFGYTCGNDFSCRHAQKRTSQWLIGKSMPGFGPCGPYIVTADSFDPDKPHYVRSYVNGEMRQNGSTDEMIFNCAQILSYASKYLRLMPGDLIFTGTPSGVILEKEIKNWLKPGDFVEVEIEGIGTLRNELV